MPVPRVIEMVWECPSCGTQMAQMTGTSVVLPTCSLGHAETEMEQRCASRWGCKVEEEADHQ